MLTLASLELDAKETASAQKLIDQLRHNQSLDPVVRYLDTRMLIADSQWAEATHRLQGMSSDLQRWPQFQKESQFWLAHCYWRLGRNDLRVAAFRGALEVDPLWTPARLGLAEALHAMGRIDDSLLEYQRLLQLPGVPSETSIAMLRLAVTKNLSMPPNERSWGAIEKQLASVARQTSKETGLVLDAEIKAAEGKLGESRQTLRAAISANSANPSAWYDLLAVEMRDEHWDAADKLLGEMQQQFHDGLPFRLAKAEYLLRRYGEKSKTELRKLADPPASYTTRNRIHLATGLARAALAIRDYEQAERQCRVVAKYDPSNLPIRLVLFDLAEQTGKSRGKRARQGLSGRQGNRARRPLHALRRGRAPDDPRSDKQGRPPSRPGAGKSKRSPAQVAKLAARGSADRGTQRFPRSPRRGRRSLHVGRRARRA